MKQLFDKGASLFSTAALCVIGAALAGLGLMTFAMLASIALGAAVLGVLARPFVEKKVNEVAQQSRTA